MSNNQKNIVEECKQEIKRCVQRGVNKDTIKLAEKFGERLGKTLEKQKLTTSQIRNIFSDIKKMEMRGKYYESEFLCLKPKLAYAAKRSGKEGTRELKDVLIAGIDEVADDNGNKEEKFANFCKFFEAVLAYHRAFGGD
jgi:CRISPR-associated protein Csm2